MTDTKIICVQVDQRFDYNIHEYLTINKEIKIITEEIYNNMTSKETIKFFRSIGGTEKVTRNGGKVTRLVSTSPSGESRVIRIFKFSE